MRLANLIVDSGASLAAGSPDTDVTGLTADSRKVSPGFLFAGLPGSTADGAAFVPAALAAGARAVLLGSSSRLEAPVPAGVALLRADEPRLALARIAARFHPRQPDRIVAVTGTNGKTSIAEFTRQIFAQLGLQAASLGTIGVVKPGGAVYGSLTTPDPISLHRTLDGLAGEGITHLALEASSHGLDQFRLDGVRLCAAAFNNLGRDHLDYHPTVEAYLAAKLQLFERLLQPGQPAIVNMDGARAADAVRVAQARGLDVRTVGRAGSHLRLAEATANGFGQRVVIEAPGLRRDIRLDLLGAYQASNALVASALAIASGCETGAVLDALAHLKGVTGRLEVVARHKGGIAVVDYAHKPEALDAALDALRPFASGKLVCAFGCGGNRDKGKRPIMGAIAARKSDVVIVTDDNPRNEVAATIRAEVMAGAKAVGGGARLMEIGDRGEAIRAGVGLLGPGDVLLVAGKGHEPGQIIGSVTVPFSDHEAVAAAIAGGA